jgi:branched-chain amino acid transport system substrate-binding protein
MYRSLNWLRWLTVAVLSLLLCLGLKPGAAQQQTPIAIGLGVAQTSNVALLGQEQVAGGKIAERYFNQQGGINGRPIRVVLQDTGGDEAGAINAFQTLITKDKVVGIVGPTLSQQAFSADPIADRAKVPVLGPSNTAKGIPQIGEYIARVSAPVVVVAPNSIKAALSINPQVKRVAIFFAQNDAFSKSETEIFQKVVTEQGLEIVTVQKFQTTDSDFQTQTTAAINLRPDLVVISGLASDGGNIVRQLRELGYQGLIIGGNGLNTSNMLPVCKALCDGVLIAQAYSPEYVNQVNQAFRQAYKQEYGKEPPQFSAQAFTGIQVFVEALRAIDQRQKLTQFSLEDLRVELNKQVLAGKYSTPIGDISFTPEGELVQKDFYVARVEMSADGEDGKFVFSKPTATGIRQEKVATSRASPLLVAIAIFFQKILNGLSIGSVYAIFALGYTLIFSILGIINFAHGAVFTLGAYFTYALMGNTFGRNGLLANARLPIELPFWLAMLVGAVLAGLVGMAIERFAFRPLRQRGSDPLLTLVSSLGIAFVIVNAIQFLVGAENYRFPAKIYGNLPPAINFGTADTPIPIRTAQIVIFVVSGLILVGLTYLINKTRHGKAMQAVAEDTTTASLLGINTDRFITGTFFLSSFLAAIAGTLVSSSVSIAGPYFGISYGLKGLAVIVLGGLGSIPGTVVGGLLLGLAEAFVPGEYSAFKDAVAFGLLFLMLLIRPSGLMGRRIIQKV